VVLRFDDEVIPFQVFDTRAFDERANLILQSPLDSLEIVQDSVEHVVSGMLRGEQSFDVLHHENGGSMDPDDPEVFSIEEMFCISFNGLVVGASRSVCE